MSPDDLSIQYRAYIDCLNQQDWSRLCQWVHEDVEYNNRTLGLAGYRAMLEADFRAIPDLFFNIRVLVSEPPHIASRVHFDCTPIGVLFGLPVNGTRIRFDEHVIYEFAGGKIRRVWSVIDKTAIADQL